MQIHLEDSSKNLIFIHQVLLKITLLRRSFQHGDSTDNVQLMYDVDLQKEMEVITIDKK